MASTAMVQQAVQGAPATYAKEMERLSAKESLLLAVKSHNFTILFLQQLKQFFFLNYSELMPRNDLYLRIESSSQFWLCV